MPQRKTETGTPNSLFSCCSCTSVAHLLQPYLHQHQFQHPSLSYLVAIPSFSSLPVQFQASLGGLLHPLPSCKAISTPSPSMPHSIQSMDSALRSVKQASPICITAAAWKLCGEVRAQGILLDSLAKTKWPAHAHTADEGQRLALVPHCQLHHLQGVRESARLSSVQGCSSDPSTDANGKSVIVTVPLWQHHLLKRPQPS